MGLVRCKHCGHLTDRDGAVCGRCKQPMPPPKNITKLVGVVAVLIAIAGALLLSIQAGRTLILEEETNLMIDRIGLAALVGGMLVFAGARLADWTQS